MTFIAVVLWAAGFWMTVYGVKYLSHRSKPVLPLSNGLRRRPTVEVTVKNLHLRVETPVLNALHDGLCRVLVLDNHRSLRGFFIKLYDLGSAIGIIGMVAALVLLWGLMVNLFMSALSLQSTSRPSSLVKRAFDQPLEAQPLISGFDDDGMFAVRPIVRLVFKVAGLVSYVATNTRFIDTWALCICQIIHESGHAIAAALRRVPILCSGISLTVVFPSAFVVFPTVRLQMLPLIDRLRILAAGCFHNLVFWCLLYFIAWTGMGTLFRTLVFQDASNLGKVVVGVDSESPLHNHIPPGALVTKLDDTVLAVAVDVPSDDPWGQFLLAPSTPSVHQGWCIDNSALENATALRQDQQLTRITLLEDPSSTEEEVVLWSGPRREIWEQVEVSSLRPRIPFISGRLLRRTSDFVEWIHEADQSLIIPGEHAPATSTGRPSTS
ncbi:hypothetical protein ID866_7160 [Astraeus odoratus]|nr:hypothetical protein ID866_7160 [Astraeus odoratus]